MFIKQRSISAGVVSAFVSVLLQALPALSQPKIERDKKIQMLQPFLSDPSYLNLGQSENSLHIDNYGSVLLPKEMPEHEEGIFWMYNLDADVISENPPVVFCFGLSAVRVLNQKELSESECRQRGLEYLKRRFAWFFQNKPAPLLTSKKPNWMSGSQRGIWSFEYRHLDNEGLPSAEADVLVRAFDGKVVGFAAQKFTWPKHKIQLAEAKQTALAIASKAGTHKDIHMTGVVLASTDLLYRRTDQDKLVFRIGLEAKNPLSSQIETAMAHIDANTGEPVWINSRSGTPSLKELVWDKTQNSEKLTPIVYDHNPVWTKLGLAFVSVRKLSNIPSWVEMQPQLFLKGQDGDVNYLTSDLSVSPGFLSASPRSSWIALERQGWTYAFYLLTGQYRILGHPERYGATPAVNDNGQWSVVSGTGHDENSDLDLLPDNLQRSEELGLRGRLVNEGEDHHPLFSPDDKWLYFVTTKQKKGQVIHSLHRLAAEVALTKDLKPLQEGQVQTIIAELPGAVQRISAFPNGQGLLLQTDTGMFVVSIADKKITPVTLKNLKDAELGVNLEELQDGWAGPSDDEVTFSGKSSGADKKVRWRIYKCRFDGTGLQALTPKDNTPVPAYKFPTGNKTAIDLAKELALGEIKFQDEQRRQGG